MARAAGEAAADLRWLARRGRARAPHPVAPRPAHRVVGAGRHRHGRWWPPAWPRSADAPPRDPTVGLDAALVALSGRVRVREGAGRTAEDVIRELWQSIFGAAGVVAREKRRPAGGDADPLDADQGGRRRRAAVQRRGRRTTSRRELARHERFDEVSPEVGELDEAAFDEAMDEDPDEALALLADLAGATDERLRALARRLAGRLVVDLATSPARHAGAASARSQRMPYRPDAGDLDVDASLDALADARGRGAPPDPDELRVRGWSQPGTALCLLVDRSGSMGGRRWPRPRSRRRRSRSARRPTQRGGLRRPTSSWPSPRTHARPAELVVTTCSRSAATARPTWRWRCGRRASSSTGPAPGAGSPCCCRTAGPPAGRRRCRRRPPRRARGRGAGGRQRGRRGARRRQWAPGS